MTVDEFAKILDSVSRLASAVAWPALILLILSKFGASLKIFFENLTEFSLKGGGVEATAKRKQAEVTATLAAAVASRPSPGSTPESIAVETEEVAELVQDALTPRALKKAATSSLLWVDDMPENNSYLRKSLEMLGVHVAIAKSTEEAMRLLERNTYNVIVSDMGRPPDNRAGYTLLEQIRMSGNRAPYIIYASGASDPENKREARLKGAFGSTNRSSEVFSLIVEAIQSTF